MASFTNFPNGITSLGIPTFGTGTLPPFTGHYFFVEETTTAGVAAGLGTAQQPYNTIEQALAQCVSGNNDVIFLIGTVHRSSTQGSLLWNKNNTHLIGVCAPLKNGKRARISVSGTTGWNNLVNVSANGCYFMNFGTFYGFPNTPAALVCWTDTGGRNVYDTVEFLGFGDATASTGTANLTGARALVFNNNTGESTFRNCVFGVNTTQRNATNYTVELAGGAPRMTFDGCDFECLIGSSGTAASHLLIDASGIDRELSLTGCHFLNSFKSTGSTMAQAFNVNGSPGGGVLMDRCSAFGITAWETTPSGFVYTTMSAISAPAGGISLVL